MKKCLDKGPYVDPVKTIPPVCQKDSGHVMRGDRDHEEEGYYQSAGRKWHYKITWHKTDHITFDQDRVIECVCIPKDVSRATKRRKR